MREKFEVMMKTIPRKKLAAGDPALSSAVFNFNKSDFGTVIRICHKMVTKSPADLRVHELLGSAYLMTGQASKALPHLLLVYNPKSALSWWNLLVAQHQSGNIKEARALLGLSLAMDLPQDQIALITRTVNTPSEQRIASLQALVDKGQMLEAEIAAWLFLEDYPDHPLGKEVLAKARGMV
jgi:hypothetical protein